MFTHLRAPICIVVTAFASLNTCSASAGDPAYGAYLSSQCTSCHRRDGEASTIPDIVGWPEDAFVAVMRAYKTKTREHATMQTIASALGDDELAALAAYFAQLEPDE